ncbi:MAG: peptidase MA family metallohydrolase [Anaerolineae bacterium]
MNVGAPATLPRLLLAAVLLAGLVSAAASAQEPILIRTLPPEVHFAEKVVFQAEAEAASPIRSAEVLYGEVGERVRARATAEFTPGTRIRATYTWNLEPGDLPPGAIVQYTWRLEDEAGHVVTSEPQTFAYLDDRFAWEEVSAGPITLHFYGLREADARRLLEAATRALERLERNVGVTLTRPVHIWAYRTSADMRLAIPSRSRAFDERVLTLGMAMSEDTLVVLSSAPDVEMVIGHELSHLVVGLATRNPLGGLPRWLDEGLAMYAEGDLPPANRQALERAVRQGTLISVRSLSGYTGDPEQVDLYYAEVYSVVQFLLERYGRDRMRELLQRFKEGTYQEEALRQVYGLSLDELDAAWREWLGARPAAVPAAQEKEGAQASPQGGPCPGGLLPLGLLGLGLWGRFRRAA